MNIAKTETETRVEETYRAAKIVSGYRIRVFLDTYLVLDDRSTLQGLVEIRMDEACAGELAKASPSVCLRIDALPVPRRCWESLLPVTPSREEVVYPFTVPLAALEGGYFRLRSGLTHGKPHEGLQSELDRLSRPEVDFALKRVCAAPAGHAHAPNFLALVESTVKNLLDAQSIHPDNKAAGPPCLVVTRTLSLGYRSLGHRKGDRFNTYWFPAHLFEYAPSRMDLQSWPILDRLSRCTGSPRYADTVAAMAEEVAAHGFDPVSGLPYFGEEADYDIVSRRPVHSVQWQLPTFKPPNSGTFPGLSLDRLWLHAPGQMARMGKSMYYGLVTDPDRMDYNRFTFFGFDDSARRHVLNPNAGHCAFDSAGTRMIHWWCSCYAHTGDKTYLAWTRQMADKWCAVQHPESGLMPYFFGAVGWDPGTLQPPGLWACTRSAATSARALFQAAEALNARPEAGALRDQLRQMGTAVAMGLIRHAYDEEQRLFREFLYLDGRPYDQTARYTFYSVDEKEAEVKNDPQCREVPVYRGAGWFDSPNYWEHYAGSSTPWHLAACALHMQNPEANTTLADWAKDAVKESKKLTSPFTGDGRWTWRASAEYAKMLLVLNDLTGDPGYREAATQMLMAELNRLEQADVPDWWRMRDRHTLLDALLMWEESS